MKIIIYCLTTIVFLFSSVFLVSFSGVVFAQTSNSIAGRQAELQKQLDAILVQIAEQEAILTQKKGESSSLARDIAILNAQITEKQLKIKAHAIQIQQLGKVIDTKVKTINSLEAKLDRGQVGMADLTRKN